MSNFQLQLANELRALCASWNLPLVSLGELPRKTLLNGEQVEGEENVVHLGEMNTFFGPMPVFNSVDARDVLGNANWARGWCSCLTHPENGTWGGQKKRVRPEGETIEQELARFGDARDVALWAAKCEGVSLLFFGDGSCKTQGGVTRRVFWARAWLFELECGALVVHTLHCGRFESSDWNDWMKKEGRARYGLLSATQAHQRFVHSPIHERMVKGSGPLCPALERKRERVIWRGWNAHRVGAPMKGPRFWQAHQTRLCLQAGCEM